MRTHLRTETILFANSFLLLAMVAGVDLELFDGDAVPGVTGHKVLYPIELILNAEYPTQYHVFSVSEDMPDVDIVEDGITPSKFYAICFGTAFFLPQNTRPLNARPFNSSYGHTTCFNIPHQNSDEDEPFILPVDVA